MHNLRWPIHPHPIQEESLLSWLARISSCYDFSLDDLLEYELGFKGNIENLNVEAPSWLLTLLSKRTGVSENTIRSLTLSTWSPFLLNDWDFDTSFKSYVHHYSLLLPLNKRKKYLPQVSWRPWLNKHPFKISKACAICVERTGSIYLAWGLPLMLSCPIHQCMLKSCSIYHGNLVFWKNEDEFPPSHLLPIIYAMDQRTWSALTTGRVPLPSRMVHAGIWLRLLRTLLDELHIPPSSSHPIYAKNVTNIWDFIGHSRGGSIRWQPYELLPPKVQEQTLIAAAVAISRIESKSILPAGEDIFLFLPESVKKESIFYLKFKEPEKVAFESIKELIKIAQNDPEEAIRLREFILFGKTDFESIQRINNLLIAEGVPSEFLAP